MTSRPSDFTKYHVVLFGDPGSNRWIARLNGKLPPLHWSKETVALGNNSLRAAQSVPALIFPNPLPPNRYVVVNSGLTAAWADWAGNFPAPRYGDSRSSKLSKTPTIRKPHMRAYSMNPGSCGSGMAREVGLWISVRVDRFRCQKQAPTRFSTAVWVRKGGGE